jgi:hypothetical protein
VIDVKLYRGIGTASGGAPASSILVEDWNMKLDPGYDVFYYPTNEGPAAPLVRDPDPANQVLSYPVHTYFAITGAYSALKNVRLGVSLTTAPQAQAQVFYKLTHVYETPAAAFDGDMAMLAGVDGAPVETVLFPLLSTTGPTAATSRATTYQNPDGTVTLYTQFFVSQVRVAAGTALGNTAELRLRLSVDEYDPAYTS